MALITASRLLKLPPTPLLDWLARSRTLVREATNTSSVPLVSGSATRLDAEDWKAIVPPNRAIEGFELALLACAPVTLTLARVVVWLTRSCTKTSITPLVSPDTRLEAAEAKAA